MAAPSCSAKVEVVVAGTEITVKVDETGDVSTKFVPNTLQCQGLATAYLADMQKHMFAIYELYTKLQDLP